MDDKGILELYAARSPQAAREAREAYGPYCQAIAENILGSEGEAEACVSGVWDAAQEQFALRPPAILSAALGKITRRLALKRWSSIGGRRTGGEVLPVLAELEECVPPEGTGAPAEEGRLTDALAAFLRSKPMLQRMVFIRRYWYFNSVKVISRQLSLPETQVEARLRRLGRELGEILGREEARP